MLAVICHPVIHPGLIDEADSKKTPAMMNVSTTGRSNQQRCPHQDAADDQPYTPADHPQLFALMAKVGKDQSDQNRQDSREQQHVVAGMLRQLLGGNVLGISHNV